MTLHTNLDLHIFLKSFCMEKIKTEYSFPIKNIKHDNQIGTGIFKNKYKEINAYLDSKQITITPDEYKEIMKEKIETKTKQILKELVIEDNRNGTNYIIERNKNNKKLKQVPRFGLETTYMNLYYIYNAGIHQIVRIKNNKENIEVLVELPTGRLHLVVLSKEEFKNKEFFIKKELSEKELIQNWIKTNNVPKYKENYIEELKRIL